MKSISAENKISHRPIAKGDVFSYHFVTVRRLTRHYLQITHSIMKKQQHSLCNEQTLISACALAKSIQSNRCQYKEDSDEPRRDFAKAFASEKYKK